MKKTRFTENQITQALKDHEAGKNVLVICRELQINRNTFYNWKKKYSESLPNFGHLKLAKFRKRLILNVEKNL